MKLIFKGGNTVNTTTRTINETAPSTQRNGVTNSFSELLQKLIVVWHIKKLVLYEMCSFNIMFTTDWCNHKLNDR
jgi:hypothetical protein